MLKAVLQAVLAVRKTAYSQILGEAVYLPLQPVQPPEQPLEQPLKHDVPQPEHCLSQLLLHPLDGVAALRSCGAALLNTTAPKMGRAAFAALLKNSRLDWSSSFVFLFSSIIE
jgi:hypothetical protein